VPGDALDPEALFVEEGVEVPVGFVGLPADAEAKVVGELGLRKAVAEGREQIGVAAGGDLDEDHGEDHGNPHTLAACLETSWNTPDSTAAGYRDVGAKLARAVAEYLAERAAGQEAPSHLPLRP
jgi:hypothetical protein